MADVLLGPRLSSRAASLPPSPTATLDAEVKQLIAAGTDVINLTAGETEFPTPQAACEGGHAAIAEGFTKYTPVPGIMPLRQAIADRLEAAYGLGYTAGQVVVSNGAKQALFNALLALLEPGDEVLFAAPYWVSYPEMVTLAGGVPVAVETGPDAAYQLTADLLRARLTARSRILLFNNPTNPTGVVYNRDELSALADVAGQHDLAIVSDEIYADLVYEGAEFTSMATLGHETWARTVTVNGFSKTLAMTGWRLGYAAAPDYIAAAMSAIQGHTTSAASSISQRAALAALSGDLTDGLRRQRNTLDERRRAMLTGLAGIPGMRVACEPAGAFYVLAGIGDLIGQSIAGQHIDSAGTFARVLLDEARVAVVPGTGFGAPDHIRLSYVVPPNRIAEAIDRIRQILKPNRSGT